MNKWLSDDLLDALSTAMDGLRLRFFYVNLNDGKTGDKHKSVDFLVDSLCLLEKHFPEKCTYPMFGRLEFDFLKQVLEKNAPLFVYEDKIFGSSGVKRDRSGISSPEAQAIKVQAAAQILWHLEGGEIPTIEAMKKNC